MKRAAVPSSRPLVGLVVVLLVAQFALGMVVNLYVTVPGSHPGAHAGNYFTGVVDGVSWAIRHASWSLAIHAALGLVLVIATLALLVQSIRARSRRDIATTLIGAVFTIAAGFNGASFLNYGKPVSSLLMSIFFIVAFSAYMHGLQPARRG